jgi:hypothetical protein
VSLERPEAKAGSRAVLQLHGARIAQDVQVHRQGHEALRRGLGGAVEPDAAVGDEVHESGLPPLLRLRLPRDVRVEPLLQ